MNKPIFYIAGGKMFCLESGREREIPSGVLQNYITRTKERARRNEWKTNGSGAAFLGEQPVQSAETQVANLRSSVGCLGFCAGKFLYSLRIGEITGIYSKRTFADTEEGIVLSDSEYRYSDFDVSPSGDLIAVAAFAGEAHLALLRADERSARILTEGDSVESAPVWSKVKPDTVIFSSAGLLQDGREEDDPRNKRPTSYHEFMMSMMMGDEVIDREQSAQSISEMNLRTGEIVDLLTDPAYSFVRPQCDGEGNIYYIKKPFRSDEGKKKGGCLVDLLLAPFRLIRAIVGFFNIFTVKYSGKNLTAAGGNSKAKKKDEEKIFIDGNLIAAEKERRENQSKGDAYPGIIPRSFELRCLRADGEDRLIRKGVLSYRLCDEGVLYSNGSYVLLRRPDGSEEKLIKADKVTFILA